MNNTFGVNSGFDFIGPSTLILLDETDVSNSNNQLIISQIFQEIPKNNLNESKKSIKEIDWVYKLPWEEVTEIDEEHLKDSKKIKSALSTPLFVNLLGSKDSDRMNWTYPCPWEILDLE